VIKYDKY